MNTFGAAAASIKYFLSFILHSGLRAIWNRHRSHSLSTYHWERSFSLVLFQYDVFINRPVESINEAPDHDIRIARLPWRYEKLGETSAITGLDVLTIVGGKIKSLYAFIDK